MKVNSRTLKSMLLATAALTAVGFANSAIAQDAPEATDEKVTVTGTRIKRANLTSVSPVSTLSATEVKTSGTTSIEQLLNNQPTVVPGQTGEVANGATGIATVDLRGLGPQRTLVLINGRRVAPGDPFQPVADLNAIPVSLISRVEVVSGGASAVYGSDALAGAVNFIMKRDFEGVQIDAQYAFAQHTNDDSVARARLTATGNPLPREDVTDAEVFTTTVTVGANTGDGKGNVTLYAAFSNFQELRQDQRDFSACSYLDTGASLICLGSSNFNRFTTVGLNGGSVPAQPRYFINPSNDGNAANNSNTLWNAVPATVRAFNFAPDNFLQRPRDTYQFGGFAHYEISKHADVYAEVMFTNDTTRAQIAASGAFAGSFVQVNCDNPLMSAAQFANFCGAVGAVAGNGDVITVSLGRRNIEGGPRQADLEHSNYRVVTGVKGEIAEGFDYDVYGMYSKTPYSQVYRNEWSKARVTNALNVDPITGNCLVFDAGTDLTCRPLDIFSGLGALGSAGLTPDQAAALAYVTATGVITGTTEEQVVSGSFTGDLGTLGIQSPGSDRGVQLAAGVEYRRQAIQYDASRDFQIDDLFGQGGNTPSQPLADYDVFEAFGELEIPLVSDKPFFKLLSVNAGYRISDYETAGITHAYKYGAEWAPSDDIRFRGSFNRATRAPNVLELFGPIQTGLFGGNDPCAGAVPTATLAQCINMGLATPAQQALYGSIPDCPSAQCQQLFGGNPNLKPEDSDTITYGFVFTPTFLKGFSLTVDYFDIEVSNRIGQVGPGTIINQCLTGNLGLCALVSRDPLTGGIAVSGFGVQDLNVNAGTLATAGIDIEAGYAIDVGSVGNLSLSYFATVLDKYEVTNLASTPYDCVGFFGVVCGTPVFEYRHKARATWATPWDVDLSVAWRHYSEGFLDANTANPDFNGICGGPCGLVPSNYIEAFDYFDLSGSWNVSENYTVRFGVNNVADKNPPVLDSNTIGVVSPPLGNANTYPGTYDSFGREFFIGGTAKF
ncbi:MAG TPA: TonB-dependent receptor [Alphaproteobacteria bacterium]|nr:TonB-dependent receptor [Alphaproteobacteria bacterium]